MKYKAIAALAMLGGAGAALAQSSVTLYGSANFLGAHKVRLYLYL